MPGNLRANPFGNLKTAFDNGMKLFQCIDNETAEQEARRYGMMSSLQSYIQRRNIKPYSFHKEAIARWQNEVLRCWRRNSTTTSPTSHIAILLYFFLEGRAQLPFIFGSIFLPQWELPSAPLSEMSNTFKRSTKCWNQIMTLQRALQLNSLSHREDSRMFCCVEIAHQKIWSPAWCALFNVSRASRSESWARPCLCSHHLDFFFRKSEKVYRVHWGLCSYRRSGRQCLHVGSLSIYEVDQTLMICDWRRIEVGCYARVSAVVLSSGWTLISPCYREAKIFISWGRECGTWSMLVPKGFAHSVLVRGLQALECEKHCLSLENRIKWAI